MRKAIIFLAIAAGWLAVAAITEADRRKSEYIFVEAQNWKSRGQSDAYFDLVRRAYEVDTTNTSAAFYYGHALLSMRGTTPAQHERALELMRKHFVERPDDFYETTYYSDACMTLGHTEQGLEAIERLCQSNPGKIELQARLAEAYTRLGQYARANATLDSIELHHGQAFSLTSRKVSNHIALNDTAAALAEMHRLLDSAPASAQYNMGMAGVMAQFDMPDSTLHYLDAAQQAEPANGYTYLAKAQFYRERGDSAAYDRQVLHALTTDNLELDDKLGVLTDYIRERIATGDTTRRVSELFGVLLEQHPHEADIHGLYTEYLATRRDYAGAAEQQGYVLDINPTDADGWRRLMILDVMAENYPAAIAAAERALEYNPDSLDLYGYIAPTYFQMKEYDKALATYHKALALADSTDLGARSSLIGGMADVLFEQGDTLGAFAHYEEALELDPLNAGALNNYAYFLSLCRRDLDKAERMAGTAVRMYPNSSTYLDTYAWVLFQKGDTAMALTYIQTAIEADDDPSADLLEHYGDILDADGQHDRAREQWQHALELAPDNEDLKRKLK